MTIGGDSFKYSEEDYRESIYVDDVVMGANDMHEAFMLYRESNEIISKGDFNLRKFATNCRELQGLIDAEEHGISVSEMPTETFAQYTLGRGVGSLKVLSAEFYFHKPITVHLELYLFYFFIAHRSVLTVGNLIKVKAQQSFKNFHL